MILLKSKPLMNKNKNMNMSYMAVWWFQLLIRIIVWISVNQRVYLCVLPHLRWQRKWAENISCQRGFAASFSSAVPNPPPTYNKPVCISASELHQNAQNLIWCDYKYIWGDFLWIFWGFAAEAPSAISSLSKSP